MTDAKRRTILTISPQFLVDAVKAPIGQRREFRVVAHALPADATVVAVSLADPYFGRPDMIAIALESASFDLVPTNCRAIELPPPHVRTVYPDDVDEPAPGTPAHEAAWRDLGRPADALDLLDVTITRGAFRELLAAAYRDTFNESPYLSPLTDRLADALWLRLKGGAA